MTPTVEPIRPSYYEICFDPSIKVITVFKPLKHVLTNSHGLAWVKVCRRADLNDVRPLRVVARDEHAHAVGPLVVALDAELHLVAQVGREDVEGHWGVVEVPLVEALGPHPLGQGFGVGGQAGEGHAQVVVDRKDLEEQRKDVIVIQGTEKSGISEDLHKS